MVELSYYRVIPGRRRVNQWTRLSVVTGLIAAVAFTAYWSTRASADVVLGLHDGSMISATGQSDANIYIVNDAGYKRIVLNPSAMYSMYGHLNASSVMSVSAATRDQFQTSGLFRNCETNAQPVYALEIVNGTTGVLHWVNMSGDAVVAVDPVFFRKVFCINSREQASYTMGVEYVSVTQIPTYSAGTSPTPFPVSPTIPPSVSPSPSVSPTVSPTPSPAATPLSGTVTISLSANNQAAANISRGAMRVPLETVTLTNTNNTPVTIDTLSALRSGTGTASDFNNLYVYYNGLQVGSGMGVNSSTNAATFNNLAVTIPANSSIQLTLMGDVSSAATVGTTSAFQISGPTFNGTTVGNFMTIQ